MKKIIIIIAIIAITATTKMEAAKNKYAVGVKAMPSLSLIPYENFSSDEKLLTGSFTMGVNGLFKVSRKFYIDFGLSTTSYTVNDKIGSDMYGLSATNISIMGITYFDKPDGFTPYLGYGFTLSFQDPKEPEVNDNFFSDAAFAEFAYAGGLRLGFIIPIADKFVGDVGLQLDGSTERFVGLVPKAVIGVNYWLD